MNIQLENPLNPIKNPTKLSSRIPLNIPLNIPFNIPLTPLNSYSSKYPFWNIPVFHNIPPISWKISISTMHFGPPDPIILVQGSGRIAKGGGTGDLGSIGMRFFFGFRLGEMGIYRDGDGDAFFVWSIKLPSGKRLHNYGKIHHF